MNFSKQLKKYRELNHFSQETLAEKIYVTRQTISKWENDKSYPDIHNLVALSALFGISLDELVKGDLKSMENELAKSKFNFWTWNLQLFCLLTPLSIGPVFKLWGIKGLYLPLFFAIWLIISGAKTEKIKRVENLKTYSEILAFVGDKEQPEKHVINKELDNMSISTLLTVMLVIIIFLVLMATSFIIFN
ncbi:helix-turn-helix domain-containing protein [Enterococcus sp. LJL120]